MILDLFFKLAVPFVIVCVVLAKILIPMGERGEIYGTAEKKLRRDEINRKYRTNRGAAIIAILCALAWILMLFGMIEEMGAKFFTFVIWALLFIPFATVCSGIIMVYMYTVHGVAHLKQSSTDFASTHSSTRHAQGE